MRILGLDPGSITIGYGVIQINNMQQQYIASGCIKVAKQTAWPQRLKQIYQDILLLIEAYEPEQVAIEQVFVHKNPATALKLGQARGAMMVACSCQDLPIAEYAARHIKQAVVGYGNAEKSQIQHMVQVLLKLTAAPVTDAADALAVAICHANIQRVAIKLKG